MTGRRPGSTAEVNPHLLILQGREHVRVSFALGEAPYSYADERDCLQIFEQTVTLRNAASASRLDFSKHAVAILIEPRVYQHVSGKK
jgi:hypothetical protein